MANVEHITLTLIEVNKKQAEYDTAKSNLKILEAKHILCNNWEELLGKAKPTQKEKDSYVAVATEEKANEVATLKRELDYLKRLLDIQMMAVKY